MPGVAPQTYSIAEITLTSRQMRDVFLVLDGPQARAMAPSGAFGTEDRNDALRPVFAAIADADIVGEILKRAA